MYLLNETNSETNLKQYLDGVLRVAEKKFSYYRKADTLRIKWGRLILQCVKTYGELIQLEELDKLRQEIDEIKNVLKMEKIPL